MLDPFVDPTGILPKVGEAEALRKVSEMDLS